MSKIRYELRQQEIEESLICLDFRIEGNFKRWNAVVLSVLGALLLAGYLKYPDRFYLAIGTFAVVLLLICILYLPQIARKRKAINMAQADGYYEIEMTKNGMIVGESNTEVLFSAKVVQLFDSENVITIRMEHEVLCIPKRVLNEHMVKELKTLIIQNGGKLYNVSTKKG